MSAIAFEVLVIVVLLAINGIFAMSELAIVTARKVRLEQRAEKGDAGAKAALALAQEPTRFLSTIQVGITLIGVMAGAFGGATIAEEIAVWFTRIPAIARYANALALALVVTAITYLSLLIGELIPKRVALSQPERIASLVARPMTVLSHLASPVVQLLTRPTNLVLRLFGIRVSTEPSITVEEIQALIEQGAESGVVEDAEHELVDRVFQLGDRVAGDIMTPRLQLRWVDLSQPAEAIRQQLTAQARPRYLVCEGSVENVLGVVYAEDLLLQSLSGQAMDLRAVLWPPMYVPATMSALDLLERFRQMQQEVAVVLDEFGGLQGVATLDDVLEAVVGEMDVSGEHEIPDIVRRDQHTWVMAGKVSLEEVEDALDVSILPDERRGVRTLGGFIMALLSRIPRPGESAQWRDFHLEIARMDGRRIVEVVVRQVTGTGSRSEAPGISPSLPNA